MIGKGAKALNRDRVENAEDSNFDLSHPLVGLSLGILGTVLVQSSSVSTTTIVSMVGSVLTIPEAVPMVIGANIGTTVTNTIVSVGHVSRDAEFRRAFAAATIHDFFNLLATIILLPIELMTGFISKSAVYVVETLNLDPESGAEFKSPIKSAVGSVSKGIHGVLKDLFGPGGTVPAVILMLLALLLIFVCLALITKNMRHLIADRLEASMNSVLAKSGLLGLGIGIVLTIAVQSSSITTSILVPMCGAGVLRLSNAYPIILGANLGTTTTALLASIVRGPAGLTVAVVHLLFNTLGIVLLYPIPAARRIPMILAEKLAEIATRRKIFVLAYMVGVFLLLPALIVLILS